MRFYSKEIKIITVINNTSTKFDMITKKVVGPLLIILIMFFSFGNTIIGRKFFTLNERGEIISALLLSIVFCVLFFKKGEYKKFIKKNIFVILYLIIRLVLIFKLSFDYSTIRSVFFEAFFLIVISEDLLKGQSVLIKKSTYLITGINLALNAINLFLSWNITSNYPILSKQIVEKISLYGIKGVLPQCTMYANPNSLGIMSAFSILILANLIRRKKPFVRIFSAIAIIFNLYCIYASQCRSAIVALLGCLAIYLFRLVVKNIDVRKITAVIMLMCLIASFSILGYAEKHKETGINYYHITKEENLIENMSSGRYLIWKTGLFAHKNTAFLGSGSAKNEINNRARFVKNNYEKGWTRYENLGPHNGYLAMLWCSGILGSIMFFAGLLKKIFNSRGLEADSKYLILIFIFVINMFESMFIVNRYFVVLYLFLILAMDEDKEVKE